MEDFIPFEIAKDLKEKGFREKCLAYYTKDTEFYYNTSSGSDVESAFNSFNSHPLLICGKRIDAPTISQVLNWLREEKKIHISINIYDDGWCFDIASFYKADTGVYEIGLPYLSSNVTPDYETYEQAALVGIEYVLDNLI